MNCTAASTQSTGVPNKVTSAWSAFLVEANNCFLLLQHAILLLSLYTPICDVAHCKRNSMSLHYLTVYCYSLCCGTLTSQVSFFYNLISRLKLPKEPKDSPMAATYCYKALTLETHSISKRLITENLTIPINRSFFSCEINFIGLYELILRVYTETIQGIVIVFVL